MTNIITLREMMRSFSKSSTPPLITPQTTVLAAELTEDPNVGCRTYRGSQHYSSSGGTDPSRHTPKHIKSELPRACYIIDGLHNGVSQPLRLNGPPGGKIAIPYY
jgi:hypothetical protein